MAEEYSFNWDVPDYGFDWMTPEEESPWGTLDDSWHTFQPIELRCC